METVVVLPIKQAGYSKGKLLVDFRLGTYYLSKCSYLQSVPCLRATPNKNSTEYDRIAERIKIQIKSKIFSYYGRT